MTPNIDPPPDGGLAGEVKTPANVPIVNVGDTMWTRVTATPTSVAVRCRVQSTTPADADWSAVGDCYNAAGQNFPGGLIGFCPHYWGYNWLGNVTVKSYNPATSAFDMTEHYDSFTVDSNGYASDTLTYDNAGNLTYDGTQAYTYDAWNRLITVSHAYRDASNNLQHGHAVDTMAYDAKGRRIVKAILGTGSWDCTCHDYYSNQWQLLEERNGSNQPVRQNVWGQTYVDELVQTTASSDPTSGPTTLDHPYYAMQDANWNVLGVVTAAGVLTERYEYTPYGLRTCFFSPGTNDVGCFAPILASRRLTTSSGTWQPWGACENGLQGLSHEEGWGAIDFRNRDLSSAYARFLQRDPDEFVDSDNLYLAELENPLTKIDPQGLTAINMAFDAFIGQWHNSPDGPWIFEPNGLGGTNPLSEFLDDNRGFGQLHKAPLNARVASFGFLESTKIGNAGPSDAGGYSATGVSHRRHRSFTQTYLPPAITYGPWIYDAPQQAQIGGGGTSVSSYTCETKVIFSGSAAYPYLMAAPDIDYLAIFDFKVVSQNTVKVQMSGWTNRFPDYEGYAGTSGIGNLRWTYQAPDPGPGFMNLNSGRDINSQTFNLSVPTPTNCPCGSNN